MRRSLSFLALSVSLPLALAGCDYGDLYLTIQTQGSGGQAGSGGTDTGGTATGGTGGGDTGGTAGSGGQGGEEPFLEGAPESNTAIKDLDIDLFGKTGNRYWFAVDPEQVKKMNAPAQGGFGDIYTPGQGANSNATYVNHLFASNTADLPGTADFGKVEVRVIGQSTFRPWQPDTIPNLRVDMDEFQVGQRLDGMEHFRFNNGLVGSIFREELALEMYAAMGYPAPRATFAWVGSNVWGPDVQVPYTLVEVYKKAFCTDHKNAIGGDCANMWEVAGDIPDVGFYPGACQLSQCTTTRLDELASLMAATPKGPGWKAATADYLAWDKIHESQCLSWMLLTGDDTFHNNNNLVLVERDDGKFMYLPYSIDISAGQDWYQKTPLSGINAVANGCQSDAACWADLIATCDTLIGKFAAIDPPAMVDAAYTRLKDNGMLRSGDEERYHQIHDWYQARVTDLPAELLEWQEPPCQSPNVDCEGQCIPYDQCVPTCAPDELQCGPKCAPAGQCFDCQWPYFYCGDGSCQAVCPF
jgi:hypothetical protein